MGKARAMARQFREQLEEEVDLAEDHQDDAEVDPGLQHLVGLGLQGPRCRRDGHRRRDRSPNHSRGRDLHALRQHADPPPPPPEAAAADAAAAETAHAENPNAPAPEPEAAVYEPPAYAHSGTHESFHEEEPSAAKSSAVESPPSPSVNNTDEEGSAQSGRLHHDDT